jgi:LmbE family N-acetylglucosaminyl deacetylase
MRHISLSPHLDDSVLSAGGLIYEQAGSGVATEIWTIMAGRPADESLSPLAARVHREWGVSSPRAAVGRRRAEDATACTIVGAVHRHFDFLDAIYRKALTGGWLYADLFSEPSPEESELPREIAFHLARYLSGNDRLYCPLGVGGHVDHRLVRLAIEMLGQETHYLLDFPYVLNSTSDLGGLVAGMNSNVDAISERALQVWTEAAAAYGSQLGALFGTAAAMPNRIRSYWAIESGIRLWLPSQRQVRPP